jgi:hypothetical protein
MNELSNCPEQIVDKDGYSIEKTIVYAKSENLLENDIELLKLSLCKIYETTVYLEKIKEDLVNILGDFMISFNDIPAIIHVIITSINFLKSIINVKKAITPKIMKYIIFGILYRIIIDDGKISDTEEKIIKNYEFIWSIINFSPSSLEIKKITSKCFCF